MTARPTTIRSRNFALHPKVQPRRRREKNSQKQGGGYRTITNDLEDTDKEACTMTTCANGASLARPVKIGQSSISTGAEKGWTTKKQNNKKKKKSKPIVTNETNHGGKGRRCKGGKMRRTKKITYDLKNAVKEAVLQPPGPRMPTELCEGSGSDAIKPRLKPFFDKPRLQSLVSLFKAAKSERVIRKKN